MPRYRKVEVRIWNDSKFVSMSDDGKLIFLFLLTHPHMTSIGAMKGGVGGLSEEMRWDTERLREAFREGVSNGMIEHDEKALLIVLPNFIKHNAPENPNVVKSWRSANDLLPESPLKDLAMKRVRAFLGGHGKDPAAWIKAFDEAFGKGMPNQEQ